MNEKQQIDRQTREKYAIESNKKSVDPNWTMSDPMNEMGLGTAQAQRTKQQKSVK